MNTFVEQLRHLDRNIRSSAALSLGKLGDAGAVDDLIQALCVEEDLLVREDLTWALVRMADAALQPLIDTLTHESAAARHHAAHVLGKIRDNRAVDGLIGALHDDEPIVLAKTVFSLGQIGDERAVPALMHLLGHENREVHNVLVNVLETFGEVAIEPLTASLKNERWQMREQAADILGLIGGHEVVPALIEAGSDEHWQVRFAVAAALRHIGGTQAKLALRKMENDPDERVREVVMKPVQKRNVNFMNRTTE